MNREIAQEFKSQAIRHLREDFLPKIQSCMELLEEDQIWWRPNENSNSVGNLVLHLCGNVRQWIVSGVGGQADTRKRDLEFANRTPQSRKILLQDLQKTIDAAVETISAASDESLLERHRIQIYEVSGLQAIFHVVEHFSYHTGQIIFVTKMLTGRNLGFYADLETKKKRF